MKNLKINPDIGLLILRVSVAALMLLHGIPKLIYGVESIQQLLISKGLPGFAAYGVYIGEVVAPILLIAGFRARLASLVFVINMIVIIITAHSNEVFAIGKYGGLQLELIYLYMTGALSIFFTGAGKLAISTRSKWD
ncbi:MAG: DoxX family protein [Bacteroidales bacterium]|nr:DoxX family protein [Bacteroidales bacterium]HOY39127.1 DoxX family protein [Bacteroidales bacterium]HQP03238.1 DoxX family protein [Bacteroidales bacterium]